ncbi:MAG: hypothetical protein U5N26_11565 [Candidatus Marinimicrobia bacterium]|nr:hypothetical protein [Candidatus Neomarinimicrobiota bacterium]
MSENRWKMEQIRRCLAKKLTELSGLLGFDINNLEGDISTKYSEPDHRRQSRQKLILTFPGFFNNKLSAAVGSAVKKMFSDRKVVLYYLSTGRTDQRQYHVHHQ